MSKPNPNLNPSPSGKLAAGAESDQTQAPGARASEAERPPVAFLEATGHFELTPPTDATTGFDSKTKGEQQAAFDAKSAPQKISSYRIGSLLGQGGMGRVFRAVDSSGSEVAIKLLSPNLSSSADALARFKQEGLIASQINHPHIVFVHRVDEENGIPFIAMELMTGKTLKDLVVENGPLNYDEAVRLILQCIEGLIEAHARGMIHRDIKPANCYLDQDGSVKVGDFGLARSLVSDSELTQTGAFLGTPLFASPEQLLGQTIDSRSDIYSLSATLYFLLAGKAPFESPNAAQVIARIASTDPPSFKSVGIEVPNALEDIVIKGLSRDASKRYQNFVEMRQELQSLLAPRPERASFSRRIVAGVADWFIVSTAFGLLLFTLVPFKIQQQLTAELLSIPFILLYYWICEAIFGTSLGKGALHIQIVDLQTCRKPAVWRSLQRALAFLLVTSGPSLGITLMIYGLGPQPTWPFVLLQGLGGSAGYGLCLFGWFYYGQRQMPFDWLSDTACQITPSVQIPFTHLELPAWKPQPKQAQREVPASLGRFQITQELEPLNRQAGLRWFAGVDPQLDRTVWIILSSDTSLELEEFQRAKPKWNRIRFIEEGRHPQGRWFAYVAAEGMPLEQCLAAGVQLSWPQTRSVIGQLGGLAETCRQAETVPPSSANVWIDRAGRLSVVDFHRSSVPSSAPNPDSSDTSPELGPQTELVRTICSLALSPQHKYRRKKLNPTARNSNLPVQVLMPLRARKLCESFANTKTEVPMTQVLNEFHAASSGPVYVSIKSRFLNSALSAAFLIPIMVTVWFLLVAPSLIYYAELLKGVQSLKTMQTMVARDGLDEKNWEGATPEEKAYCLSPQGKQKISELTQMLENRLQRSYDNFGVMEQTIWQQIPVLGNSPTEPDAFQLLGVANQPPTDAATAELANLRTEKAKMRAGAMNINLGNRQIPLLADAQWNANHLKQGLRLLASHSDGREAPPAAEDFPLWMAWSMLAACLIWTWLTFGGISQYLTGICFVRRDGQKIGLIRSAIRSLVLYAPFIGLIYLIGYWPLQDEYDIFWTTQWKRLLAVLPLIYLVSVLFNANRTPLDTLTGTAAVPR